MKDSTKAVLSLCGIAGIIFYSRAKARTAEQDAAKAAQDAADAQARANTAAAAAAEAAASAQTTSNAPLPSGASVFTPNLTDQIAMRLIGVPYA